MFIMDFRIPRFALLFAVLSGASFSAEARGGVDKFIRLLEKQIWLANMNFKIPTLEPSPTPQGELYLDELDYDNAIKRTTTHNETHITVPYDVRLVYGIYIIYGDYNVDLSDGNVRSTANAVATFSYAYDSVSATITSAKVANVSYRNRKTILEQNYGWWEPDPSFVTATEKYLYDFYDAIMPKVLLNAVTEFNKPHLRGFL